MPRVKGGVTAHRRHKKILSLTKGFKHSRGNLFRMANQALLKAGKYSYRDNKVKKRLFRRQWIVTLSAAAASRGLNYNQLIHGLQKAEVALDRKVLAELAQFHPEQFDDVLAKAGVAAQVATSK